MDRQTTWRNFNGGWYSDIHVPDLKHISTYLTYLRYLSTYPYLTSSSCSGTTALKVCTRYVCTYRTLGCSSTQRFLQLSLSAGCPCEFRTRTGLARWRWVLSRRSIICSLFLLRATLVGMATAFLSERGPLGELFVCSLYCHLPRDRRGRCV